VFSPRASGFSPPYRHKTCNTHSTDQWWWQKLYPSKCGCSHWLNCEKWNYFPDIWLLRVSVTFCGIWASAEAILLLISLGILSIKDPRVKTTIPSSPELCTNSSMSYTHKKTSLTRVVRKWFFTYISTILNVATSTIHRSFSQLFFLTNFMQTTTQCKQMTPLGLMIQIMWTLFVLKGYSTFFGNRLILPLPQS